MQKSENRVGNRNSTEGWLFKAQIAVRSYLYKFCYLVKTKGLADYDRKE